MRFKLNSFESNYPFKIQGYADDTKDLIGCDGKDEIGILGKTKATED